MTAPLSWLLGGEGPDFLQAFGCLLCNPICDHHRAVKFGEVAGAFAMFLRHLQKPICARHFLAPQSAGRPVTQGTRPRPGANRATPLAHLRAPGLSRRACRPGMQAGHPGRDRVRAPRSGLSAAPVRGGPRRGFPELRGTPTGCPASLGSHPVRASSGGNRWGGGRSICRTKRRNATGC